MEEFEYKCIVCGQTFEMEISLYAHITSHSREIIFSETGKFSGESLKSREKRHSNKENRSPGETWKEGRTKSEDSREALASKRHATTPYRCEFCSKMYKAKRGLKWHVRTSHGSEGTDRKCASCEKVFANEERLEHHVKISHSESVHVECDVCGKSVKKIRMNSHRRSHSAGKESADADLGKDKYECDTCKECFQTKKLILLHLVKTHLNRFSEKGEEKTEDRRTEKKTKKKKREKSEKLFKCDEENCRYATNQTSLLKAHKFKHNPFYKCVTCQEKLPSRQELKSHMSTHGERPYKCDQCNKCYKDKHGLGWHKKVQHDPSRLKFTCELCGKTYPFDSLLTQHINLTHAAEKQSVCDICGKNVSKTYLPMHRRTHGEKQYSCDVCQKTFLEKAYLKRHKMIHTGEKPYVCNVCGNLFRQHSTLTIHMRTHTGDRPYKCVLCENAYKTHHNLKKHYRRSGHKLV